MNVIRGTRTLRYGYTTGACAAAAAGAATLALRRQATVTGVQIDLPNGSQATFKVDRCIFDQTHAACSLIKDAGDDPDVTHGAEIRATVSWEDKPGVRIEGGEGVGIVTKPGLEISVGLPAINPVPRRMIAEAVSRAAGDRLASSGIKVIISVPKGAELAKRTLNPRLGIVGGISILGTTGIVVPYSKTAYTACISQALDVAVACGCRQVVLTTGRRSEKFAQRELALAEECFIQAGDFIDYSLKECAARPLAKVTVWGMSGKISKMAADHLYTHISSSSVDVGLLARVARDCGVSDEALAAIPSPVTASYFRQLLPPGHAECFDRNLCLLAAKRCRESIYGKLEIECVMSDYNGAVLGRASDQ